MVNQSTSVSQTITALRPRQSVTQSHQSPHSPFQNKNQYAYKMTHKLQAALEMFAQR